MQESKRKCRIPKGRHKEYYESGEVEELADLVEIVHAIAGYKGVEIEEFQRIRMKKSEKRGGFEKRLFLIGVEE